MAPLAAGGPARYVALAAALALAMSAVFVVGRVLRLGFMADFFSKPVLLSYVNGIALTIIVSQLGKLLGVSVSDATALIEPLPKAALGVVLVIVALALFDIASIWQLRRILIAEVGLAVVALVGVLVFGVLGGLAFAIGMSIVVFGYRTVRPHDAVFGAVHNVDGYHDLARYDAAQTVPGLTASWVRRASRSASHA